MRKLAVARENDTSVMIRPWIAFLESKGGELIEERRVLFREFQQEIPDEYIIPCTQESIICFEGTDVESFLQSQLTCDIKDLQSNKYVYGAYCNPKGRVLATFRLFAIDSVIYMLCDHSLVTHLVDRLRMFVMRSDVTIRTRSDLAVLCLNVHEEHAQLPGPLWWQIGPAWPKECYDDPQSDRAAQLIVAPVADAIEFINETETHIELLDSDYWNLLQIRHGVVRITASTSDLFTPQNLNIDLIAGVSFTKGCYPGQEIVARLRYLGRVKQRLLRGRIKDESVVRVGQSVALINTTDKKAGVIVNVSTLAGIKTECLFSVYGYMEAQNVYCYTDQPNKHLTTLPMPYSLQ